LLHRQAAHGEAVARIGWCVAEHRIGVITGEVGAGKTVAIRAALAGLDPTRHTIIYLPNPTVGVRGIHRGYPRAVNNLAVQALVAAFAADKAIVDESATRTAVAEVTAE
jgi:type II secretory pathway predicted ATPase ExeA